MKIVIDIDEKLVCEGFERLFTDEERDILIRAIGNGIPYEDRPTGEWIKGREISRMMISDTVLHIDYKDYTCSNCGLVLDKLLYCQDGSPFYKFCPECGAKMEAENG